MSDFDFSGWATRNELQCSDGRTIKRDAFKDNDGQEVPLVWNHQHNDPENVLGHALLENRSDGVYAYCKFNETESGQAAKELVRHGDVKSLSIYANQLKQRGGDVVHGVIRELSLVLAGANPGATIDFVMAHSDDGEESISGFEANWDDACIMLYHSEEKADENAKKQEGEDMADGKEKTVQEVIDSMTEEQKNVLYGLVGMAIDGDSDNEDDEEDGGNKNMKHNVFDNDEQQGGFLMHGDQETIIANAKKCGSFKQAFEDYLEDNELMHDGTNQAHSPFNASMMNDLMTEEFEWLKKGAPEKITKYADESWVERVLDKVHKSPFPRVKSRYADLRNFSFRGLGYTKGEEKKLQGQFGLIGRSFDPQTVYVKEKMDRDDIIDITDFDSVAYVKDLMETGLKHEIAQAILFGDGRTDGDENKIKEAHIKPIYGDAELYTIYQDVDVAAAKAELQGTDTGKHFGDNYVYAEAIITAALYSREKYRGSGSLDFYCTPHLLNVMLLARDLNGRRIYDSKADLEAALNVQNIYTIEEMEGKGRTTESGNKKLLGLFVNLGDYQVGSAKGGQVTSFEQFDIDFNQYKYLMETRLSGANTKIFSAIALEEPVAAAGGVG